MTLQEKISYIIGRDMAGNLKKQGIDVNPDAFIKGMKEAIEGKPSALSQAEVQEAMMELRRFGIYQMARLLGRNCSRSLVTMAGLTLLYSARTENMLSQEAFKIIR